MRERTLTDYQACTGASIARSIGCAVLFCALLLGCDTDSPQQDDASAAVQIDVQWDEAASEHSSGPYDSSTSNSANSGPGAHRIKQMAVGEQHSLLLTTDGKVYSCGLGGNGQLGFRQTEYCHWPVPIQGLPPIAKIAAGSSMSLFLTTDGELWGTGSGHSAQLGPTPKQDFHEPVSLGFTGIKDVAASTNFALVRMQDGTVQTFGHNDAGGLGHGTLDNSPTLVDLGFQATAIVAGGSSAFALLDNGTVLAWGGNSNANLGAPEVPSEYRSGAVSASASKTFSLVPVAIALDNVTQIAAAQNHTVALLSDGTVWGWGLNESFELGIQSGAVVEVSPVPITGLTDIVAVAAGGGFSLAVTNDGNVLSLGSYIASKQRSKVRGATPHKPERPWRIPELTQITNVVAGQSHAFAIDQQGTGYGWGQNEYGQLMLDSVYITPQPIVFR